MDFPRTDFSCERKGCGHAPLQKNWKTKATTDRLNEKDIFPSLSILPVSEKESTRMSGLAGRGYQAAVNFQVPRRRLKSKIGSTDIISIYAEYMDVGRTPEPGLDLADVCV